MRSTSPRSRWTCVEAAAAASNGADEDIRVAQLNIEQHERLAADPPDLAIWGEGALDPAAAADPRHRDGGHATSLRRSVPPR